MPQIQVDGREVLRMELEAHQGSGGGPSGDRTLETSDSLPAQSEDRGGSSLLLVLDNGRMKPIELRIPVRIEGQCSSCSFDGIEIGYGGLRGEAVHICGCKVGPIGVWTEGDTGIPPRSVAYKISTLVE